MALMGCSSRRVAESMGGDLNKVRYLMGLFNPAFAEDNSCARREMHSLFKEAVERIRPRTSAIWKLAWELVEDGRIRGERRIRNIIEGAENRG